MTSKSQRIFIWVIAIVMVIGTLGAYFVMILSNQNGNVKTSQELEYEKQLADYQKQLDEAKKANRPLDGYQAMVFNKDDVTTLKVETLKQGDGAAATENSTLKVNYFGWTSNGQIFDSSNKNGTTTPAEFPLSGVITGWKEGLNGVKAGSTVKLTIPADKAYGETAQAGQPSGPLMFIVEVIEVK